MATGNKSWKMHRPEECSVCMRSYDEVQDHRPRTLPCGHTFCSECISSLLKNGQLTCPSCCTIHLALNITQFPISYALEDMIRSMKVSQAWAEFQDTREPSKIAGDTSQSPSMTFEARGIDNKEKRTVGLSRKMQSLVEEQKENMESLKVALQKELNQLHQYRAQLSLSLSEHGRMIKELEKYVDLHQFNMSLLREEDAKVEAFVEEGREVERELKNAQSQLDEVKTAKKAIKITVSNDSNIASVEAWLEQSKEDIPNGAALNTSFMLLEITKAALEVGAEDIEARPIEIASGHQDCTVMKAVKNAEARPIKLADLSRTEQRKNMDAGQVFAVLRNEHGFSHSSKVTYSGNKVYFHSLESQPPPKGAFTLEMSKPVQNLESFSTMIFMDLSWENLLRDFFWEGQHHPIQPTRSTQRFHIRLGTDISLVKKLIALCLGHTGHTLCKTNMLSVDSNSNGTLTVWGGKRDNCGYSIQRYKNFSLVPNNSDISTPSRGMLVSRVEKAHAEQSMEFGIVINGRANNSMHRMYHNNICNVYCLGHIVTAELESLEEALCQHNFSANRVTVDDCGVVLQQ